MCYVLCIVHCVLCIMYCVLCTVYGVLCTVYCVMCIVLCSQRSETQAERFQREFPPSEDELQHAGQSLNQSIIPGHVTQQHCVSGPRSCVFNRK